MDLTTTPTPATRAASATPAPADVDPRVVQRNALKSRHSQSLTRLMEERSDLRGVHALADFVDEQLRWTA